MWVEFSERSRQGLIDMVQKSFLEGRLDVTIPRIRAMVERLSEPPTASERNLLRITGMFSDAATSAKMPHPEPLAFLRRHLPHQFPNSRMQ